VLECIFNHLLQDNKELEIRQFRKFDYIWKGENHYKLLIYDNGICYYHRDYHIKIPHKEIKKFSGVKNQWILGSFITRHWNDGYIKEYFSDKKYYYFLFEKLPNLDFYPFVKDGFFYYPE
jgi:hypothetical protein